MRLSINLPVSLPSLSPAQVEKQIFKNKMLAAVLALFGAASVHADATLTYELTAADGSKNTKKFSTARFYVRIDDPVDKESYLLFEAGKFFPLYAVNPVNSTYSRLTPEVTPYMSPQSRVHHGADKKAPGETAQTPETATKKPAPKLKPTKKQRRIAGIECRIVHELHQDKAVIEHCMANSARLGVTDREVITMARTFEMARNRDLGWLGTGSGDEAFVSIYSKDLRDNRVLQITAVSNKPLEAGYLRIPREYKQVTAEAKRQ
jgi:hypothetical protein